MSINFGTGPETHLDRSQRVGVVPCSIWNNVLSEATIAPVDGSLLNLLDSHAEPTGAELHYQIAYFGWNSGLPRYGNFRLMDGWAGLADPGTRRIPEFISIRNLPDWVTRSGYDVYIYCDSNFVAPHARVMHFTIDGQRRVVKEQPSNFGGRFVLATSESVDEVRIGNYVVFRGLTSPHFTLTGGAGTRRAAVCGIQIVPESTREEVGARSATTDSPTRADEDARRPRSPDAASAVP